VLPDGTLFGEGVKTRIKEALLAECNLHTIVRLPNGVFNPYTGIRTNLLFFTKGAPTTHVWYYEHPYPPGAKSYNKGKPIRIEEFEAERAWWGDEKDGFKSRVENEQAWRVSIDQIKAGNFNLDLKNPHNADTGPGDVGHLLPEYEKLLAQIAETRAALKQELHHALQNRHITIETLFEKYELFADAPNAVAKMRELVLELAVRGKLVTQDVTDEPASELLKRVLAEKIRRKARPNRRTMNWGKLQMGTHSQFPRAGNGWAPPLQQQWSLIKGKRFRPRTFLALESIRLSIKARCSSADTAMTPTR